ncbi:MAG: hypothetical protein ACFFAY_09335 [Promethearchaeota archaeon]
MNLETTPEDKVRYLSLVRREGGEPIVGIPYREMSVDPDLVASFVLAIIIFENRQLKTFTKEGYVVIIEEGKHVVGLLIVDRVEEDDLYRSALREIIERFEEEYDSQLISWKGDIRPFRDFALRILEVYPFKKLDWELVPRLLAKPREALEKKAQIPWSVGETDAKLSSIMGFINGKRSLLEIAEQSGYPDSEVMALVSMLDRYDLIAMTRKLEDTSILEKIMEPPMRLLGVYGEQLTKLVEQCDGTKTLQEICELLPYNMEAVKTVARNLIDAGVLGFVESV